MRIIKIDDSDNDNDNNNSDTSDAKNYIKQVAILFPHASLFSSTSSTSTSTSNMCKGCVYDAKEYCSKARPTNCHLGYIFKKDIPAIFKDL